jgi:hypothetical protein
MKSVDNYTYLGVTMPYNMRGWDEQERKLIHKLNVNASLISRTNRSFYSPPGPICCLTLVKGILLAQAQYVHPFVRFTDHQLFQQEHIIARPLKAALGLPPKSSTNAVLCEFGLPDIRTFREKQLLHLYLRSSKSNVTNLSEEVDQRLYSSLPNASKSKFCRPIDEEIVSVIDSWDLKYCNRASDIRDE